MRRSYDIRRAATMEDIDFNKKVYVERIIDVDPLEEERRVKTID